MSTRPSGIWRQSSYRDEDGNIWLEQPDGSYVQDDPFAHKNWLFERLSVICAAAWAKLTVVQ
jgi:hypothetical protein